MNRVMMLVFPTLWSPKKTSLYLANGAIWGTAGALPFSLPGENKEMKHNETETK